jgi:hypothetical protein
MIPQGGGQSGCQKSAKIAAKDGNGDVTPFD